MKRATILILLSCMALSCVKADKTISITVRAGEYDRTDCVVSADIFKLDMGESMDVVLYEQTGKGKKRVASQVVAEKGKTPLLYWILDGETKAGTTRTYHAGLTPRQAPGATPMDIEDTQKALILKKEGKQILQYNYTHVDPPDGVDKAYGRSGFIHPAYSPAGNILTTIQPKDHYHHYGIWNTWTHVVYDEVLYDLWNIGGKQGTVRAKAIEETCKGAVLTGYTASLDHYIFTPSEEKVIINELWKIKAWNIPAGGFLWDFESLLHPSAPLPVLLQQYRYAGFGYRATEEWTK
ncbi:MAG: PmoA family protein, partial [Tannerellaceae bacterium]|nr:PmoA family protein [Tannerellaceae bacterium]